MNKGTLIGIGVGPGDPELMTLKAVRMIRENKIMAIPGKSAGETVAYSIALQAVPELKNKTILPLHLPMARDMDRLVKSHQRAAAIIEAHLAQGENVVFLTLGDPSVYSTFSYIRKLVSEDGYTTETVSGITSFCAAAAAANISLGGREESIHILPAAYEKALEFEGGNTRIFMKSGKRMRQIKEMLRDKKKEVTMVENCGMENEKIYRSLDDIPDESGYFSVIIARDQECSF